jgi:conjugal transfer/entry exclusion protein
MRRTRIGLITLAVLLGGWTTAHAQGLPVFDAANLVQNLITAVQTVFIVANQVLELTGLDEIVLGEEFSSDMDELAGIVREAQGLSYDLSSLNAQVTALFSLDSAPHSTQELAERLGQIRQVVFESRVYALRTQTLLQTTLRTVQRLTRLVAMIGDFVGNMQGNQSLAQLNSTVTEQLAKLQVQSAAFERAETVDKLTEPLLQKSLENITEQVSADYPRVR